MAIAVTPQRSVWNPLTLFGGLVALLMITVGPATATTPEDEYTLIGCGIALLIFSVGIPMATPARLPTLSRPTLLTIGVVGAGVIFVVSAAMWTSRGDRIATEARALYAKHDYRRAAEMFGRALAVNPNDARLHTDLGWSYIGQSQCFPAKDAFQAALRIEPGLAQASRGLEVASRCAAAVGLR